MPCILAQNMYLNSLLYLKKDLSVRFGNREYRLLGQGKGYRLRGALVTVRESFDGGGSCRIARGGRESRRSPCATATSWRTRGRRPAQARKRLAVRPHCQPAPDHPWRSGYRAPPSASPSA